MNDPDREEMSIAGSDREVGGETATEAPEPGSDERRLWVEDYGVRRPFMRGILIHSLIARGVPFEEASRAANIVRDRLRPKQVVDKTAIVSELLGLLDPSLFEGGKLAPQAPEIIVHGRGRDRPFSKGLLSQSLLAAALDPDDAFEIAREIERALLVRQATQIDRSELRQLTHEMIARRSGEAAAERYLVWRHYEDPSRPVILLLGGAAGVGKTTIALEVAHRLGIGRVLSTDSIRQIMRLMLSPDLAPALHGSSYDAYTHFPPGALGDDPLLEAFRAQTATVSVGVRASIERAIDENASTIIDGVSLFPGTIDLAPYAEQADIVFLVVAALEREAYAARFMRREKDESLRPAHQYLEHLDAILQIQDQFLDAAEREGIPIVVNDGFDQAVMLVIQILTESLAKRPGFDRSALL